jgi:hypothetical protein
LLIHLPKTTYQEFDAWLCDKAKKHDFYISYDRAGLIDDLGNIEIVPKWRYPLKVYMTKIRVTSRGFFGYDPDGIFIIEKEGENLVVCPKCFTESGKKNLLFILEEIRDHRPETRAEIDPILSQNGVTLTEPKKASPRRGKYTISEQTLTRCERAVEDYLSDNFSLDQACKNNMINQAVLRNDLIEMLKSLDDDDKRKNWIQKLKKTNLGKDLSEFETN